LSRDLGRALGAGYDFGHRFIPKQKCPRSRILSPARCRRRGAVTGASFLTTQPPSTCVWRPHDPALLSRAPPRLSSENPVSLFAANATGGGANACLGVFRVTQKFGHLDLLLRELQNSRLIRWWWSGQVEFPHIIFSSSRLTLSASGRQSTTLRLALAGEPHTSALLLTLAEEGIGNDRISHHRLEWSRGSILVGAGFDWCCGRRFFFVVVPHLAGKIEVATAKGGEGGSARVGGDGTAIGGAAGRITGEKASGQGGAGGSASVGGNGTAIGGAGGGVSER
jgi:hypothetical protein